MAEKQSNCIYWIRRDLRLRDNPALRFAMSAFDAVIPIFIWCPEEEAPWQAGAASRWWLHHSLSALKQAYDDKSVQLLIRSGSSREILEDVCEASGAEAIVWNRLYDPEIIKRDKEIKTHFRSAGLEVRSFQAAVLTEPWAFETSSGGPYKVFTPFWRKLHASFSSWEPSPYPRQISGIGKKLPTEAIDSLKLLPEIAWDEGFYEHWQPGEEAARKQLKSFLKSEVAAYQEKRDFPAADANSRLSPALHFGELSPNQVWVEVEQAIESDSLDPKDAEPFLRQLAWRDFAHSLLFHFPKTTTEPLMEKFVDFPWKRNKKQLEAWQKGQTGYPLVDAGMRELWQTGIMHNRVRMVVASFLVKHLLQPWQEGAAWFWDTLLDADLANNTMGWQWTAGCGADAAPYFRVFNPITQAERFDKKAEYIKRWVPELADLPLKYIYRPWDAPQEALDEAGIVLGKDYPLPIIEHAEGRERALEAYEEIKS